MIKNFKQFNISEGITDYMKPKSEEAIKELLADVSLEEWIEYVEEEIDKIGTLNELDIYVRTYDDYITIQGVKYECVKDYEKRTIPTFFAKKSLEHYYTNEWVPEGSNGSNMEIKIISGDGVEYRYVGDIIPHGSEIEYEYDEEAEEEDESYPVFKDARGNDIKIDNFMVI